MSHSHLFEHAQGLLRFHAGLVTVMIIAATLTACTSAAKPGEKGYGIEQLATVEPGVDLVIDVVEPGLYTVALGIPGLTSARAQANLQAAVSLMDPKERAAALASLAGGGSAIGADTYKNLIPLVWSLYREPVTPAATLTPTPTAAAVAQASAQREAASPQATVLASNQEETQGNAPPRRAYLTPGRYRVKVEPTAEFVRDNPKAARPSGMVIPARLVRVDAALQVPQPAAVPVRP